MRTRLFNALIILGVAYEAARCYIWRPGASEGCSCIKTPGQEFHVLKCIEYLEKFFFFFFFF